ncbi:MAG: chromate transporter [Bacillota bacterium]
MIYWQVFLAFFIPGVLGYGGGPSSIPLVEHEVVKRYGWLSVVEFGEVLALGNALPGPIMTKMAGYIGYQQAGIPGAIIAVLAAVGPSMILMISLLGILYKYKDSPRVQLMTVLIRPVIAVLLAVLTYRFLLDALLSAGVAQTVFLIAAALLLMERLRVHPALVISGALLYGAVFLG